MSRRSFSPLWLAGAVLIALLAACSSDNSVTPPPPTPAPVWSEIADILPNPTLYALWAPSQDSLFAVGVGGEAWFWDGHQWSMLDTGTERDLSSIAGNASGEVVAVGASGTAVRLAGSSFTRTTTPTLEDLQGVCMVAPDTFIAVGGRGVVMSGNGTDWALEPSPTSHTLLSVWAAGRSDVFAVGVDGVMIHRDAIGWQVMQSGTTEMLTAVNGTAHDDVYAVGAAGTILHYDGGSWSAMASGATTLLQSVWAPGGEPVAVGANGTILRLTAGTWTRETPPTREWLYAVARAGTQLWVVGTRAILAQDGAIWSLRSRGSVPILRGLSSSAATGIVAVGDGAYVALEQPGGWHAEDAGAILHLNAVWTSPHGDVFAAGTNHILRYTNPGWAEEDTEPVEFTDIGGTDNEVFAVGVRATIRSRVGHVWAPEFIDSPTDVTDDLHGIGMGYAYGYAAGANGRILHYDGVRWRPMESRTTVTLWDIAPVNSTVWQAIAVGDGGAIFALWRPTGGWYSMTSPTTSVLYALAPGPDDELYAVGTNGTVLVFAGDTWRTLAAPTTLPLLHAWSRGSEMFVCGGDAINGGLLLRYGPPIDK